MKPLKFTVNFRLQANKSRTKSIQLGLSCGISNSTLWIATGETCLPELWDKKKRRPKTLETVKKLILLEERVNKTFLTFEYLTKEGRAIHLRNGTFKDYLQRSIVGDEPEKGTGENFSEMLPSILGGENESSLNLNLSSYIIRAMEEMKVNGLSKNTLKPFNNLKNKVLEYGDLPINRINTKWVLDFLGWFRKEYSPKQEYYNTKLSKLKQIIRKIQAERIGKGLSPLNINIEGTSHNFLKKRKAKHIHVILNIEKLKVLYHMQFKKDESQLEYVRDLTVIFCFTGGLRYSDFFNIGSIQTTMIDDKEVHYIESISQKTNTYTKLPLFEPAYNLLKKHNFQLRKVSEQHFGRAIKKLCEKAGFNDTVTFFNRNINTGKVELIYDQFFKRVSSRTIRKSFCSNMYFHYKLDPYSIMPFSGHSELKSFLAYVMAEEENQFSEFARVALSESFD